MKKQKKMDKKDAIKLFQDQKVRVLWEENLEKWFFSIVDVVGVLTDSPNPRKYWSVSKSRLRKKEVSWQQIVVN